MGMGVVDPGGNPINHDGSGRGQDHSVGFLLARLLGLVLMSTDIDPISWLELVWCGVGGGAFLYTSCNLGQMSLNSDVAALREANRLTLLNSVRSSDCPLGSIGWGQLNMISNGMSLSVYRAFRTWHRAKGRRPTPSPPVSMVNLVRASFSVRFICSTCSEL